MESQGFFALFMSTGKELASKLFPDEIIVMTAGSQAAHSGVYIGKTFIAVYAALVLVLTTSYLAGAILGARFVPWFSHRRGIPFDKEKARSGFKHMGWMLSLGLFFPYVRYLVPFLAGVCRFRLRHYLLVLLPSCFIWTFHYFLAGYWFSDKMEWLEAGVYNYSKISLAGLLVIGVAYALIRQLRRLGNRFHL